MSEKQQHNAERTRQRMSNRYGELPHSKHDKIHYHHKHDKRHLSYRLHSSTHGVSINKESEEIIPTHTSTGTIRKLNLEKLRKRFANKILH